MPLTRDEQIDQLLALIQISDSGVIRFCPKNPDGTPHQRMAIGPTGLSVSDDDPDPMWYASGNGYFGGRVGVQSSQNWADAPTARKDLSAVGFGGFASSFTVENNNISDQVTAQVWQANKSQDGLDDYTLFVSSADAARPGARNIGLRVDATNDQGQVGAKVTGVQLNLFGADADNRGVDVSKSSNPSAAGISFTGVIDTTSMTDTQYITYLYQSLLNRAPDSGGLAGWVANLSNGWTRAQVHDAFINSAEYKGSHP